MAGVKATFFMRVYNVEPELLRRAVESVLNQTEPNFRFIIQDNGSTDGSKEILEEYAETDSRIALFRNEINSKATYEEFEEREEVLWENFETCESKYFAIIDSDDAYETTFLEHAFKEAEYEKADIVFGGYRQVQIDGTVLTEKLPDEAPENFLSQEYPFFRTLWGKLYSGKLWREYWRLLDVDRPEFMKNGLDTYIVLSMLSKCDRLAFVHEIMYIQTIRKNSIYHADVRTERIKEADVLFLKGIEVAHYYDELNEETISFLASVYYYHLLDIANGILKTGNCQLKNEFVKLMNQSEVFGMLSEKNKDLQEIKIILQRGIGIN